MNKLFIIFLVLAILQIGFLTSTLITKLYYSWLIAPLSQIASVVLGIIASFFQFSAAKHSSNLRVNYIWGVIILVLGVITSVTMFLSKIYMICFMWIVAGISLIRCSSTKLNSLQKASTIINDDSERSSAQVESLIEAQNGDQYLFQKSQTSKCQSKCKNCLTTSICIINTILILLFTVNFAFVSYYRLKYNDIGSIVVIDDPTSNEQLKFNTYCSNVADTSYPTLILEHGGGGNLVGFLPLFQYLQQKKIRGCAYDRLGYGRSGKALPEVNPEEKARITNKLISKLVKQDEQIIYGGWSAGVELSILYQYYYPKNIVGLVFMDGYPDYQVLTAISKNQSEVIKAPVEAIANIIRIFEPFCIDLFFGQNEIKKQVYNDYYKAYYRTGYFWETQSIDVKNDKSTNWLSNLAAK